MFYLLLAGVACAIGITAAAIFARLRYLAQPAVKLLIATKQASQLGVDTGFDKVCWMFDGDFSIYTRPYYITTNSLRHRVIYIPEQHHKAVLARLKYAKEDSFREHLCWLESLHHINKNSPLYKESQKHLDKCLAHVVASVEAHCNKIAAESDLHLFENNLNQLDKD